MRLIITTKKHSLMVRDETLWNPEYIIKSKITTALYFPFILLFRNNDNHYVCIFNSNKQQIWTYIRNSKSWMQQKKIKINKTCCKSFQSHSSWYMKWNFTPIQDVPYDLKLILNGVIFLKNTYLKDMTCSNCFLDSLCVNSMLYLQMQAKKTCNEVKNKFYVTRRYIHITCNIILTSQFG